MRSLALAVCLGAVLAGSCGDSGSVSDAPATDGPELDAQGFPPLPALGAQIDRVGRAEVNGMLNSLFEPNPAKKAAKRDAYNHAVDPAAWSTTILDSTAFPPVQVLGEFSAYLGALDAIDIGHPDVTPNGCGNLPAYVAPPGVSSNNVFASVLADDQLYIDTSRSQCDRYLAVELSATLQIPYTSCGGRTLTHDVIDTNYSLMFAGRYGFTGAYAARLGDGVGAHGDVNNLMFPFLGAPH